MKQEFMINKNLIHPNILPIISRSSKEGYYCPVCSFLLRKNSFKDLICSDSITEHEIVIRSYPNTCPFIPYFTFDLWFSLKENTYHIQSFYNNGYNSKEFTKITNWKSSKFVLEFNHIIDDFDFTNLNSIADRIETYFLLS